MNELSELKAPEGSRRKKHRVGRGPGSGSGKTSGKGHKGQNSRSGGGVPVLFEGGQMPYYRRAPKYGFKNRFRTEYNVVNIGDLSTFDNGATVGVEDLVKAGLVRKGTLVKILGDGTIDRSLTLKVHKASKSATAKIEAAGGTVEVILG